MIVQRFVLTVLTAAFLLHAGARALRPVNPFRFLPHKYAGLADRGNADPCLARFAKPRRRRESGYRVVSVPAPLPAAQSDVRTFRVRLLNPLSARSAFGSPPEHPPA